MHRITSSDITRSQMQQSTNGIPAFFAEEKTQDFLMEEKH